MRRDEAPSGSRQPYSEEAERSVLGSCVLDPDRVIDLCVARKITPAAFFYKTHAALFGEILDMHQAGMLLDAMTLGERLRAKGLMESMGGPDIFERLINATPTAAHAEHYISIVYEYHLLRTIMQRADEAMNKCRDPELSAETILSQTEQAFFDINFQGSTLDRSWNELVSGEINEINRLMDHGGKTLHGIPTGYIDFDKKLLGMQPTDMIILAARPSMGKTSLALNIAEHVAMGKGDSEGRRRPVAVFSLEMSAESLVRRMLCCHARVCFADIAKGFATNDQHARLMSSSEALRQLPIYIDDTAGLDVMELRSRARRLKKRHNIDFIVVDYLQLLNCEKFSKEGRQRETMAISAGLKGMAKELKVPVLVLSQLSRAPETRDKSGVPKLSDLRDSGSIEQDADVVFLLRRPVKNPNDPECADERLAIVDVAKHRNGETGDVRLNFVDSYTRFEDRVENHPGIPEGVE
jgi:replicative DNA helicase